MDAGVRIETGETNIERKKGKDKNKDRDKDTGELKTKDHKMCAEKY